MTTHSISATHKTTSLTATRWLRIGLQAALGSILAVLLTQVVILALWPGLAAFKPLNSYTRSAVFTLIPVVGATAVFAWLVKTKDRPGLKFLWIAAGFLLLSVIPDYLLPLPGRTFAASTSAAFMHLVAGVVTTFLILAGFKHATGACHKK